MKNPMKSLMKIAAPLVMLMGAAQFYGQTTTVTATITDSQGTAWASAPYSIIWAGQGNPSTTAGQSFTLKYTGTTNSSGALSVAGVTDVKYIAPSGSLWNVCVTSAVSSPATYCIAASITDSSMSLSTQLSAAVVPPSITGGAQTWAYADSEVSAFAGNQYYRTSDGTFRCYTSSWGACLSAGGVIGSTTQIPFNNAGVMAGDANLTWTPGIGLNLGSSNASLGAGNWLSIGQNYAGIVQTNIQNFNSSVCAQSGYSATEDNGSNTLGFMWLGINNSGFNCPSYFNIGLAGDTSLLSTAGNMYLANGVPNKAVYISLNGTQPSNILAAYTNVSNAPQELLQNALPIIGATLTLTAATQQAASSQTTTGYAVAYTGSYGSSGSVTVTGSFPASLAVGYAVTVSGMTTPSNNGVFILTAASTSAVTYTNWWGVTETAATGSTVVSAATTTSLAGTITGGAMAAGFPAGAYAGIPAVTVSGFTTCTANNGTTFPVIASSATYIAVTNAAGSTCSTGSPVIQSTAAVNSPKFCLTNNYGSGAGTQGTETSCLQNVMGAPGTNPTATLQLTQTGSTGLTGFQAANFQAGSVTPLVGAVINATESNVANTTQINVMNTSSDNAASSDLVATSDNGSQTTHYIDVGCNSSTYNQAAYNSGAADDCYMYAASDNLNIATATSGKTITFNVGGTTTTQLAATINATGLAVVGNESAATHSTATNCTSSAAPAVCGSAAAGSVVVAASGTTVVVNTTAVTANSQIIVQEDSSLGTKLTVTCNVTPAVAPPTVSARVAATSFTITTTTPTTNPRCFSYTIVN